MPGWHRYGGCASSFWSPNVLQFYPPAAEYDSVSGAILYATLPQDGASYEIDISTPYGAPLKAITNSTATRTIQETWDLTNSSGGQYTGGTLSATFKVTPAGWGTAGQHTQTLHRMDAAYVPDGHLVVAYAWDDGTMARDGGPMWQAVQEGVVDTLAQPPAVGGLYDNVYALTYWNDYSGSGVQGEPGWLAGQDLANTLVSSFLAPPGARNFHFDGHGSRNGIGNDLAPTDHNYVNIGLGDVARVLDNLFPPSGPLRGHPYRFVFLNACNTADDDGWAKAFGVVPQIDAWWLAIRPWDAQAFVGWRGKPRAPVEAAEWYSQCKTYTVLYGAWMSGFVLDDCLSFASAKKPLPSPLFDGITLDFPLGIKYAGTHLYTWEPPFHLKRMSNDFGCGVYGYRGIARTGYEPGY